MNSNENNYLSAYTWAERSEYHTTKKTQKHKRRRKNSQAYSFNRKDSNSLSMLTLFLKDSSIYAFNRIGNSPTPVRKIFWIIILILGVSGCLSQVGQYLASYYKYPVVINIESINTNEEEFPSVTLCNLNSVRKSFLPCFEDKNKYGCSSKNNETITSKLNPENKEPFCDNPISNISDINISRLGALLVSLDYNTRFKYGHQQESFITNCSFGGKSCGTLEETNTYVYGNCFTFNPNGNMSSMSAGPASGLELDINLELDEFSNFTRSVGVRVQIHQSHLPHDIESKGFALSPGFEHYVSVTKTVVSRLPAPFKDHCRKYKSGESQKLCKDSCEDQVVRSKCFCSLLKYHDMEVQQCDLTNPIVLCCLLKDYELNCDCSLACNEIQYKTELSSAFWPSKIYYEENKYYSTINDENGSIREQSFKDFRKSHLRLKVYFDKLGYTKYSQKAAYQSSELLSMIGGQMGLWLGLSLIAIFECFESIVMLYRSRNQR